MNTLISIENNNKRLNYHAQLSILFKLIKKSELLGRKTADAYSHWNSHLPLPSDIREEIVDDIIAKLAKNMLCNALSSIEINNK